MDKSRVEKAGLIIDWRRLVVHQMLNFGHFRDGSTNDLLRSGQHNELPTRLALTLVT